MSQIIGRNIPDGAVDGDAIRLLIIKQLKQEILQILVKLIS